MYLQKIIQLIIYLEDVSQSSLSLVIGYTASWLLTREFPEQTSTNVVVNELTVEINPIHPIHPLIDLRKFSSYIRVIRIMIRVLEFCQSPANFFEKLVRQEQLLHCTSIRAHLTNNRVNVNVEVKTTIKQLNLYLENDTFRSKGRIINSELPIDATTPLFLPNKSHLVDLLINHIHSSSCRFVTDVVLI